MYIFQWQYTQHSFEGEICTNSCLITLCMSHLQ